ncbi:hypothetical protein [Clostridium cibarium]|uniref:ABC-2 family transporter protein n=1 Tax=Clostridium cibarium TaxID=2762247 RepID=A0ABR8PYK8_9CLOT|nr:hypothetical protein [Clostridium cibarium]MBD7913245.1 hypothetical protein [Clostridium cibarium]
MKTYFKLELKKSLSSWRTKISILIIIAMFMIPYFQGLSLFKLPFFEGLSFIDASSDGINCYIKLHHYSYIGFLGPTIAAFIYSTSIISDRKNGFLKRLLEIIDIKTYLKVKLAVNALVTSIVFIASNCIFILYLTLFYGVDNGVLDEIMVGVFPVVYKSSKVIYIILLLVVIAVSSACFSTFMLGATTAVNKKFIAYLLSIFYAVFTGIFFEIWGANYVVDFNVAELFNLIAYHNLTLTHVIIYDIVLALIGIVLLYKVSYKKISALY